ncbi:hypothetical protein ASD88_05240 [Pelomonas sp. Root662]|nr:hypothetical protein ASC81_05235 [Pelomonas sp. Root405]KRA78239.1 hypothetical protein ASD88_05240 [Pelomonas sp. Root662]
MLTRLAEFRRVLNDQFDACRRAPKERRGLALRRACAGVELLCHLQQHLLQPVLGQAPDGLDALHDLTALSGRTADDAQQRAVAALLEGLVQLQFAQIDEALADANLPAARWAELDTAVATVLAEWPAPAAPRQDLSRSASSARV